MQVGNLRKWLRAMTQEDEPDDTHWRKVEETFQSALRDGNISNKSTRKMLVLMPPPGRTIPVEVTPSLSCNIYLKSKRLPGR